MSAPKPPAPPDPVKTAEAQGAMNRETAISQYLLGATNQKTPFGSLTYTSLGSWGDALQGTGSPGLGTATPSIGSSSSYAPGSSAAQTPGKAPQQYLKNGNDDTPRLNPAYTQWENDQRYMQQNGAGGAGGANGAASTRGPSQFSGAAYDVPRFQVEQTLTPDLQAVVDNFLATGRNLSGTVNETLSKQFDTSGLPARAQNLTGADGLRKELSWNGPEARYTIDNAGKIQKDVGPNDFSADRLRVEDALFSRLNPQFERDQARQEADLIARGIRPGSKAYDNARDELNRSLTDARMQTVLAGGQEQSRLSGLELNQGAFRNAAQQQQYGQNANDAAFYNSAQQQNWQQSYAADQFANAAQNQGFNQNLAAGQFNNANRGSAIEEAAYLRSLPLNEINALLGGTQIAKPQFQNTPQPGVAGVDYTGLVNQQYQGQLAAYNAQAQNRAGMLGGLAGIGGSIFQGAGAAGGFGALFSDRRLKTDIKRIGTMDNGLPLYSYRYVWGGPVMFGAMADEVEVIAPAAVGEEGGFKTVDYGKLAEAA